MKRFLFLVSIYLLILCASCGIKKMQALASCEFKLDKVNEVSIAGVKINPSGNTKITFADAIKIANSYSQKKLPITVNLDLDGRNPNTIDAQMSRFDWKLSLKNEELINGTINNGLKIPKASSVIFNFSTQLDAFNAVDGRSLEEIKEMVNNAFDTDGNPKELKLFIKPYLVIGKINIPYPGYIEISKYYKSK